METGIVKWYNDAKDYGFIIADSDGADILAERHEIRAEPQTLFEYQKVEFERISTDNGLKAANINITMTPDFKLYEHEFVTLKGQHIHLSRFVGQTVLVVNTASACGLTPQYQQLEELYQRYKDRGFVILAFPANNFAGQEPGTNEEIKQFCETNYGVSFYVFEKSNVVPFNSNSPGQLEPTAENSVNSFYKELNGITGKFPQWNFHKYLISPDATIVKSFDHFTEPLGDILVSEIEKLLEK